MLWLVGCAAREPLQDSGFAPLQDSGIPALPEGASGRSHKPGWASTTFAVAAANPLAAEAGAQMLRAGGSALDAAVAVQMVLTLVEPQSSGIGSAAFYSGPVAADIATRVQQHASNPGRLTLADLAGYSVKQRTPLCTDWRTNYRVCGMPPPSSGHLAVMQVLGLLDAAAPVAQRATPALQAGLPSADWLHLYTQASRLAYADRAQYVADPDFTTAPAGDWASLLDPAYLRSRAALIGPRSLQQAAPGVPGPSGTQRSA